MQHLTLIILLKFILGIHFGMATNFSYENDPWNPNPSLACEPNHVFTSKDVIIAHPTLPCLSKVFLYAPRTHRSVVAVVADRGPRKALADLAPATTRALKANGSEPVIMVELP